MVVTIYSKSVNVATVIKIITYKRNYVIIIIILLIVFVVVEEENVSRLYASSHLSPYQWSMPPSQLCICIHVSVLPRAPLSHVAAGIWPSPPSEKTPV